MSSCSPPEARGETAANSGPNWQRILALTAAAAAALYFLWKVQSVLPPFLIAFFLAALLDPIVSRFQSRGMPRARAVALIFGSVFLVLVTAAVLIVPAVVRQVEELSANYDTYSRAVVRKADELYLRHRKTLEALGVEKNPLEDSSGPLARAASTALNTIQHTLIGLSGQVLWLLIIPLALFYFLMDFQALRARILSLFPERQQPHVDTVSQEIVEIFGAYFRSLGIVCVLYGSSAAALFFTLGLRYALFLGIAAGALYAVPYVGPLITAASAVVISLTMNPMVLHPFGIELVQPLYSVLVAVLYFVMHFIFDYGITPRLVGGSVGLHPLVNIFALMCGATLFGVWGMLIAVPVAASIRMLLIYFFPRLGVNRPLTPQTDGG